MSWEDELKETLGLNSDETSKQNAATVLILKQQLAQEFATAFRAMEKAYTLLATARKGPNLMSQGSKRSLSVNGKLLEIKMSSDQSRFDVALGGVTVDSIAIFVSGGAIVLESTKQAVDTDEFIGQTVKRLL